MFIFTSMKSIPLCILSLLLRAPLMVLHPSRTNKQLQFINKKLVKKDLFVVGNSYNRNNFRIDNAEYAPDHQVFRQVVNSPI